MTHSNSTGGEGVELSQTISQRAGQATKEAVRYGATLPVAATVTVGLMLAMAGLVAAEFKPQDKSETATFEIKPVVEDIPDFVRAVEIDPLREVEIPPAPPVLDTVQTVEVILPEIEIIGKETEFEMTEIDMGSLIKSVHIDKDPIPLLRVPPVFPNRFSQGNASGYCRVQFDINPQGQPFNVSVTLCTDKQLQAPTVKSVQRWKYAPKVQGGQAVTRTGLQTTIRFDLQDERGKVLPVPAGY